MNKEQIDNQYKLNKEIELGISFLKNRAQERSIFIPREYSLCLEKEEQNCGKKPRKKFLRKKKKPAILCRKISEKTIIVDRRICTRKQFYEILSRPRSPYCPEELEKPKSRPNSKAVSPRFAQLSIPNKRRVYYNWRDNYNLLSPKQVLYLQELLRKKETLYPQDARTYFKNLDKEKKRKRKLKKLKEVKKEQVKKTPKNKILKEIDLLAKLIVKHLTSKDVIAVKCIHLLITEQIKDALENELLIPKGAKRSDQKNPYSCALFNSLDHLSVWIENNITFNDLESDTECEEGGSSKDVSSSSMTFSYSDVSSVALSDEYSPEELKYLEELKYKNKLKQEKQQKKLKDKLAKNKGLYEQEGEYEGQMEDLLSKLTVTQVETFNYGEQYDGYEDKSTQMQSDAENEDVFDEESLAQKIIEEEDILAKYVYAEEGEAKEKAKEMYEMDEKLLIQIIEQFVPKEIEEENTEKNTEVNTEENTEENTEKNTKENTEENTAENEENTKTTSIVKKKKIENTPEEHSPDSMCCVTIKTWAKWLVDVAHNTYHWCQWILDIIARVRYFAAIIKGEVKNPDGTPRELYQDEWKNFTNNLDKDVDVWFQYNRDVKHILEKINSEFQSKRIICCPACVQSKLIISHETVHQVTTELIRALNTSAMFRDWLDDIVSEAKKFRELNIQLAAVKKKTRLSCSCLESEKLKLGYYELKNSNPATDTKQSSEESVFLLEEFSNN